MPSVKRPRDIAISPLPRLLISNKRTTSSTFDKIKYGGHLRHGQVSPLLSRMHLIHRSGVTG